MRSTLRRPWTRGRVGVLRVRRPSTDFEGCPRFGRDRSGQRGRAQSVLGPLRVHPPIPARVGPHPDPRPLLDEAPGPDPRDRQGPWPSPGSWRRQSVHRGRKSAREVLIGVPGSSGPTLSRGAERRAQGSGVPRRGV